MSFVSGLDNNKPLRLLCLPFSFYYWVIHVGGEASLGIHVGNSASYIHAWLRSLKSNPKTAVTAMAKAEQAVDYILGRQA